MATQSANALFKHLQGLFGLNPDLLVTRLSLEMAVGRIPELTLTIRVGAPEEAAEQVQRFRIEEIDEPRAGTAQPQIRP